MPTPTGDHLRFNASSTPYYVAPAGDCLFLADGYAVCGRCLVFSASSAAYTPPNGAQVNFTVGSAPITATEPIEAHATVAVSASAALSFVWNAAASVSLVAVGDLTVHVELAAQPAEVTIAASGDLTVGYQITGTTRENEQPVARQLRAYAADTGVLLATTTSAAADGAYLLDLADYKHDVYVLCLGSDLYGPLAHGPVTPDGR